MTRDAFSPRHILFLTDLSATADLAFQHALMLARIFSCQVHVLYALDLLGYTWTTPQPVAIRSSNTLTKRAAEGKSYAQIPFTRAAEGSHHRLWLKQVTAANAVSEAMDGHLIDLLVVGITSRQSIERFVFGSVAAPLLRRLTCPVWIVGPGCRLPVRQHAEEGSSQAGGIVSPPLQILFPSDLRHPEASVHVAQRLLDDRHGRLTLLHVLEPRLDEQEPSSRDGEMAACERQLASVMATAQPITTPIRLCVAQAPSPAEGILDAAQDSDLIVMSSGEVCGWTLAGAGTAARVIATAHCPVLIVPAEMETAGSRRQKVAKALPPS